MEQVRQLLELNKDLTNQIVIAMVSCDLVNGQVLQVCSCAKGNGGVCMLLVQSGVADNADALPQDLYEKVNAEKQRQQEQRAANAPPPVAVAPSPPMQAPAAPTTDSDAIAQQQVRVFPPVSKHMYSPTAVSLSTPPASSADISPSLPIQSQYRRS